MRGRAILWIVVVLVSCQTLADSANSANWPSFRGPAHTGVAPGADPPLTWSENENVRWKVKLEGKGHASPVVWGNRIYVLAAVKTERELKSRRGDVGDEGVLPATWQQQQPQQQRSRRERPPRVKPTHVHQFVVSAYALDTGERIWRTVVREEVPHESLHSTASQASASPVTDGKHIWAFFGSRGLYCLDSKGKVIWEQDLGTQSTRNEFGEGASPVVHGDLVVINWDHEGDSFVVAFDKKTGKERWRVPRDEPTSWSTPLVVRDGERDVLVVSAANRVRGYDLKSGKERWNVGGLGLNVIPTPVADGETVWVMSGWREAHGMAIRYRGAQGDLGGSDRVAWETERGLSYVPSAVLVDGRIYFFQRFTGILSCYRLKSGEPCYDQQRIEGFENIYGSPVAAGNRIYAVSRDGGTLVFGAGNDFEVLARNELDDVFNATPAIVGDTIVLRGDDHLYTLAQD
jgi:outer membrane protein assembly factor BamB